MHKPSDVFDRDRDWAALTDFVTASRAGSTLGLVYGRRRQGKTFLLQALTEATDGLYLTALLQSREQNLRRVGMAYQEFTGGRGQVSFHSWEQALDALLGLAEGRPEPLPVVIDEFPYLLNGAPELPSALQALLSPRGRAASTWPARLILCGSASSTMRELLTGTAPLRGRAALELLVTPFGYRDAAAYWGVDDDPDLAVRLHALVGGTPAYLDMCGGAGPASGRELDAWVARTLLNPMSAMFREGQVLLAEDPALGTSSYLGILAAISQGRTRRGEIAAATGRADTALAHQLTLLVETGMVASQSDALRRRRTTFRLVEPLIRLHQLVIAPNEAALVRHRAEQVWSSVTDTVSSNIYSPHFEELARDWCIEYASTASVGGHGAGQAARVAPSEIACREHGTSHQLDVVVLGSGTPARVQAVGEAKWRNRPTDIDQLRRLQHIRHLLGLSERTTLLLFSRRGFTSALTAEANRDGAVQLVDLERLYHGD